MNTEKQFTPMQELIEILGKIKGSLAGEDERTKKLFDAAISIAIKKAEYLLPKEKQMVVDAYNQDLYGGLSGERKYDNGGQYYNAKFK